MKKQIIGGAGIVVLGLALAGAAGAQPVYVAPGYAAPGYAAPGYADPALPPYEIMSIVRSTGLRPLSRPTRRGPNYVLVAMDRAGRQMQVVVDARLGDIVNLHPAFAAAPYGAAPYGSNPYAAAPYGSAPYGANGQAMPPPGGAAVIGTAPSQGIPSASVVSSPRTVSGSRPATDSAPTSTTRSAPSTKTATTPTGTIEIPDPPAPPLPRPRPKLAANEGGAGQTAPSATVGAKSTASAPAQQDAPIE